MILDAAIDLFLDGYFSTCRRSERTVAAYRLDLAQFAASHSKRKTLRTISPEQIERWALDLHQDGYATASVRRKLATLRVFFSYCVRKKLVAQSPLWNLRLDLGRDQRLTATLSSEEAGRLLATAEELVRQQLPIKPGELGQGFLALQTFTVLELLFATGIRVGEATALRLADYLPEDDALLIRGKGGRQRLAFLVEQRTRLLFRHFLAARGSLPEAGPTLFLTAWAGPLRPHGVTRLLQRTARQAGLRQHVTPHMLRHTAATLLLRNGADLRIVQEYLGHASISTTQRYTHITKAHLQATLERCHPGVALSRAQGLDFAVSSF